MSSNLQLLSFFVSLIYGILFYFLTILNFKLIKDLKLIVKHLLTLIYVLDITIIYIIIFYHLNQGVFHIYFIFTVFAGFFLGFLIHKKGRKFSVKWSFKN